jgi:hypothetical protein
VLISLLALLVMAVSAGIQSTLGEGPIVLEGPSTLELGLIGGGVIVVYAVATRTIWRRRARIRSVPVGDQLPLTARPTATVTSEATEQPSRGAA